MTTNLPLDPAQPIDYEAAQLARAAREAELAQAAADASVRVASAAGTATINGRTFTIVDEVVAVNLGRLQDAEESGSITQLIATIPLLVVKGERDALLEILRDEDAGVTTDKLGTFYKDAMEVVNARPSTK